MFGEERIKEFLAFLWLLCGRPTYRQSLIVCNDDDDSKKIEMFGKLWEEGFTF